MLSLNPEYSPKIHQHKKMLTPNFRGYKSDSQKFLSHLNSIKHSQSNTLTTLPPVLQFSKNTNSKSSYLLVITIEKE